MSKKASQSQESQWPGLGHRPTLGPDVQSAALLPEVGEWC